MKPSAFDYHAPESIDEAVALLAELGDGAKVLAGGQSLVPMISLRLAYFDHLVDIGRIDALRGIHAAKPTRSSSARRPSTRPSSMTSTWPRGFPFSRARRRSSGTSRSATAARSADRSRTPTRRRSTPPIALALDAEIEAVSPRGRRRIPADAFFDGFWTTALAPDELLVSVRFPSWRGRCGFAIREFARRFGDFADRRCGRRRAARRRRPDRALRDRAAGARADAAARDRGREGRGRAAGSTSPRMSSDGWRSPS